LSSQGFWGACDPIQGLVIALLIYEPASTAPERKSMVFDFLRIIDASNEIKSWV
jgi:hypothetical protein